MKYNLQCSLKCAAVCVCVCVLLYKYEQILMHLNQSHAFFIRFVTKRLEENHIGMENTLQSVQAYTSIYWYNKHYMNYAKFIKLLNILQLFGALKYNMIIFKYVIQQFFYFFVALRSSNLKFLNSLLNKVSNNITLKCT